ncbi:MAG TPA: gluconokinase, GntK/IdnK-type [Gaiellaceae bacterium]|jgi:carbohydrate kinase (thermoresistant glucokinase family)
MVPSRVVVMGVAGSGKSTVAAELAVRRGVSFIEGDEFHSASNLEKMATGVPLTDDDRRPWLAALRHAMCSEQQVVIACSALKRAYRDALRDVGGVCFIHLVVDRDEILARVGKRPNHFMGITMIESQFEALEPPADDETDVVSIDASGEPTSVVDAVVTALAALAVGTRAAPGGAVV